MEENKKEESFSEKLDRLIETTETGDLSLERMEKRDTIKSELVTMYLSKNSNHEKLMDAFKEIDEMDLFDENDKKTHRKIRLCAFEIAEAMDPGQYNNYNKIEQRIATILKRFNKGNDPMDRISDMVEKMG